MELVKKVEDSERKVDQLQELVHRLVTDLWKKIIFSEYYVIVVTFFLLFKMRTESGPV